MRKRIIFLLVILFILPIFHVSANSVKELQRQRTNIQRKIKSQKQEIRKVNQQCNEVSCEIERLDKEVDNATNQINTLENDISKLEEEIHTNELILEETIKNLDENMELFGERLNAMEKSPDFSTLELLLSSENLNDYLTRKNYVTEIAKQDSQLIDTIKIEKAKIEETKFLLGRQRDHTLQKKDELVNQRDRLIVATRQKQDLMRRLNSDKAELEASLNEFNKAANDLTSKIKALQKPKTSKYIGGKLAWPLPGHERITSPYGMRVHPILKKRMMHTGIDIAAPTGTPIKVSGSGTVIHAGWYASYGKMIMVDHGGGIVTLYAHCSSIDVHNGAKVKTGQTIGRIGSTGRSTGPHLHFEVRKNGNYQNPINWVSK